MVPRPRPQQPTVCFINLAPIKFNDQSLLMPHFSPRRENATFYPVYFVIQGRTDSKERKAFSVPYSAIK